VNSGTSAQRRPFKVGMSLSVTTCDDRLTGTRFRDRRWMECSAQNNRVTPSMSDYDHDISISRRLWDETVMRDCLRMEHFGN